MVFTATEKWQLIGGGVSTGVYLIVSWAVARILDTHFWWVFGSLCAVRVFFSIIETIAGIIHWRLFGKRKAVQAILAILRDNEFPPRERAYDSFSSYSARIGTDEPLKPDYRRANRELSAMLLQAEESGILAGMRLHAASDEALKLYPHVEPRDDRRER